MNMLKNMNTLKSWLRSGLVVLSVVFTLPSQATAEIRQTNAPYTPVETVMGYFQNHGFLVEQHFAPQGSEHSNRIQWSLMRTTDTHHYEILLGSQDGALIHAIQATVVQLSGTPKTYADASMRDFLRFMALLPVRSDGKLKVIDWVNTAVDRENSTLLVGQTELRLHSSTMEESGSKSRSLRITNARSDAQQLVSSAP